MSLNEVFGEWNAGVPALPSLPLPVNQGGLGNATGDASGLSNITLGTATIATLRAFPTALLANGATVTLTGYYSAGDGGGGQFWWSPGSTGADNGGTVIAPASGTGRWNRVVNGPLDAKWFGAKGDGATDDWPAIQKAIELLFKAGGGTLRVTPTAINTYRIAQALRMRSGVCLEVDPSVTMLGTGDASYSDASVGLSTGGTAGLTARYPFFSCLMFGSVEPGSIPALPVVAVSAVAQGDTSVTPSTASATAAWVAGDLLTIETTTSWAGTSGDFQPSWRQLNQVVSVNTSTGVVTLKYPVEQAVASAQVRKLTNTGVNAQANPGGDAGVPYWASAGAVMRGGIWKPGAGGFITSGGALDCTIAPDAIIAPTGFALSFNLATNCRIEARRVVSKGRIIELAWGSAHNVVRIGEAISYAVNGANVVWLNEGSHDNDYEIGTLSIAGTGNNSAVLLDRGFGNRVAINNLMGQGTTGPAVSFISTAPYSGSNYPKTNDNTVRIAHSYQATQSQYVSASGADVTGNTAEGCRFYGAISDANSIAFGILGTGVDNTFRNLWGQNGKPYCDTALNTLQGIYTPLDALLSTAPMTQIQNGTLRDIDSNSIRILRKLRRSFTSLNTTSAFSNFFDLTVAAGTLLPGDVIHFNAEMRYTGTNGTKAMSVGVFGAQYTAAATTTFARYDFRADVVGSGQINWRRTVTDDTGTTTTAGVSYPNLTTNSLAFSLLWNATSSGDTQQTINASVWFERPYVNNDLGGH